MFTLNCKGRLLNMDTPIVMGIININNESFYSGSRHTETTAILRTAAQMLKEGATILDIGGQSTRPGSTTYSVDEELQRVLPAIEVLHKEFPQAILSIDTFYAKVAREAAAAGASIINDISAGSMDSELIDTVAALQLPYVLMHMQGTPQNMQQNPQYENVIREILDFFIEKLALLRSKGIKDIIIDPGFGFGKTTLHNFCLLKYLSTFEMLQCPLLLGVSRKGMIYRTLGITPEEALNGTTVINTIGLLNGAQILRVHDVKAAVEAIKLYTTYKEASV